MQVIKTILVSVALLFLVFGPYVFLDKPFIVKYNCDLSSFHPDIPIAVKEQCRKAH
jgi:hypothetical protein